MKRLVSFALLVCLNGGALAADSTDCIYTLLGADGEFYTSPQPGLWGGYWRGKTKIYGRLDCPSALRWIAKGHYVKYRVFFATERDAVAAGFRPCKICMKKEI